MYRELLAREGGRSIEPVQAQLRTNRKARYVKGFTKQQVSIKITETKRFRSSHVSEIGDMTMCTQGSQAGERGLLSPLVLMYRSATPATRGLKHVANSLDGVEAEKKL